MQLQIIVHPAQKPVRLVVRTPPRQQYQYVGRVRALATDRDEFVTAAHTVQDQLRERARKLGADVVRLDVIKEGGRDHVVMLAGRAYRAVQ
jgi:hypothetical protein